MRSNFGKDSSASIGIAQRHESLMKSQIGNFAIARAPAEGIQAVLETDDRPDWPNGYLASDDQSFGICLLHVGENGLVLLEITHARGERNGHGSPRCSSQAPEKIEFLVDAVIQEVGRDLDDAGSDGPHGLGNPNELSRCAIQTRYWSSVDGSMIS